MPQIGTAEYKEQKQKTKAKNQTKKEPEKQDSVCSPWKESNSVYNGSIQSCTHWRTIHICHAMNQSRFPSKGKWIKKMCGVYTQWSIIILHGEYKHGAGKRSISGGEHVR